jgi:hypothetical protein
MSKRDETQPQRRPAEEWARETNTPAWLHAATRTRLKWAEGREVTSDDYKRATAETAGAPIGYGRTGVK